MKRPGDRCCRAFRCCLDWSASFQLPQAAVNKEVHSVSLSCKTTVELHFKVFVLVVHVRYLSAQSVALRVKTEVDIRSQQACVFFIFELINLLLLEFEGLDFVDTVLRRCICQSASRLRLKMAALTPAACIASGHTRPASPESYCNLVNQRLSRHCSHLVTFQRTAGMCRHLIRKHTASASR